MEKKKITDEGNEDYTPLEELMKEKPTTDFENMPMQGLFNVFLNSVSYTDEKAYIICKVFIDRLYELEQERKWISSDNRPSDEFRMSQFIVRSGHDIDDSVVMCAVWLDDDFWNLETMDLLENVIEYMHLPK